jgi:hypothetical protein
MMLRLSAMTIALLLLQGAAGAGDPVAMIASFRKAQGEVKVKFPGDKAWTDAALFMELREDDLVRVAGPGEVVVLYMKGSGTETVTAANSPLKIKAPPAPTSDRLGSMISAVSEVFLGKKKPPAYVQLGGRAGPASESQGPVIVAPRTTRLLPAPLVFEWTGPDTLYALTLTTADGTVLWSQTDVRPGRFRYPDTAPPLPTGAKYSWTLSTDGRYPDETAQFEIVGEAEAARVVTLLAELEPGALNAYPSSTVALLRSGVLFREGLHDAARRELQAAIAQDSTDPALHHFLGHVFTEVGLSALAADAFGRAQTLLAGGS